MDNEGNSFGLEEAVAAEASLGSGITSPTDTPAASERPADETMEERHDRLTREREVLLKRIEVQRLEREVRILRERLDKGPEDEEQRGRTESETLRTPSRSRASASSASKRRRTLRDDDLPPPKHEPSTSGIKLVAPEKYNGKSISAMKEYISSCETTFRLAKRNYPDDATKVLYASQYLTGETKRA
jgi:hypothetical protein